MEEKWKKFLFRVAATAAGAVGSYMTSVDVFGFAWKMLAWMVIQAVLPLMTELPAGTAASKTKYFKTRKFLSRL